MPSTSDVIEIAKVCVSLVVRDIDLGKENDIYLPKKISMESEILEWVNSNNGGSTLIDIDGFTDYVYGMCGGYAYEAEGLIGTGGIVINPATGGTRIPLQFQSFASTGSTTIVFSDAIGKSILSITRASFDTGEIIFNGMPTNNQVKWDTSTGTITVVIPFTTGELIKIIVY